mgnify:CR=1 FL=1
MKKLKKFVALVTAVAICALLPGLGTLTVKAAEPVTYYVKDTSDGWRYQVGSTWKTDNNGRELYYMNQDIKDGDLVVVEGTGMASKILDIPVALSNLTILHANTVVVNAKSIEDCFVLKDSIAAINGDVNNAYVYNNARCTFNNNVNTLKITDDSGLHAYISVGGTVNHVTGSDPNQTFYDLYSFAAGKLSIEDGKIKTDAAYYSTTAPAATEQPAAAPAPAQTANTTSDDEYDDVPKTGDSSLIFWLLGISALGFAGSAYLKKAR